MAASEELARRVVEAGRSCSLTTAVLEEWSRLGTPKQVEYLAGYLEAERSSREASKRATLLRRCALPAPKTFDGYDWSAVSWPEGMGRGSLLALDFVERREDLVLMGDVGTGKTHMASAPCALACERRLEARFFTASSLVMRLRRARDDGRLDREAALIGVSVNLFFTSFAKQAHRSRKGGFTGCANVFSPIPVTARRGRPSAGPSACRTCRLS